MDDPSLDLTRAMLAALRADAAVAALVGTRVFDRPPQNRPGNPAIPRPDSPYVSLGPTTTTPDDHDCRDGEEISVQFDVWSWGGGEAYGSAQCRRVCGAIKAALHRKELALTSHALVTLNHRLTRVDSDPDGVTTHGIVQFIATLDLNPAG